jgi:hypothetical protein
LLAFDPSGGAASELARQRGRRPSLRADPALVEFVETHCGAIGSASARAAVASSREEALGLRR